MTDSFEKNHSILDNLDCKILELASHFSAFGLHKVATKLFDIADDLPCNCEECQNNDSKNWEIYKKLEHEMLPEKYKELGF